MIKGKGVGEWTFQAVETSKAPEECVCHIGGTEDTRETRRGAQVVVMTGSGQDGPRL